MNAKAIEKTELNKILEDAAEYAVLAGGKEKLKSCEPAAALSERTSVIRFPNRKRD